MKVLLSLQGLLVVLSLVCVGTNAQDICPSHEDDDYPRGKAQSFLDDSEWEDDRDEMGVSNQLSSGDVRALTGESDLTACQDLRERYPITESNERFFYVAESSNTSIAPVYFVYTRVKESPTDENVSVGANALFIVLNKNMEVMHMYLN